MSADAGVPEGTYWDAQRREHFREGVEAALRAAKKVRVRGTRLGPVEVAHHGRTFRHAVRLTKAEVTRAIAQVTP